MKNPILLSYFMNSNKALIGLFSILFLLAVLTLINYVNHSRTQPNPEYIDDELFMTNSQCIPEIVRSYERTKNIYGKKNVLFFRYVQSSCSSCLDIQLNEILTLQEEIGKDRIWIFPAYPDDRGSRIQLSNELAKYNYRNIPADSLLIPTYGGEQKSYFAWINNDGEIDMVFIPDRNKSQHTQKYFLEIKKLLN